MFKMMKRPLALFMTIMMIFSTFMVYVPAFATGEAPQDPPIVIDIVVGDSALEAIKDALDVKYIIIEDINIDIDSQVWVWCWVGPWPWNWAYVPTNEIIVDVDKKLASVVDSTSGFDVGSYTLYTSSDGLTTEGQITLNVLANTAPTVDSWSTSPVNEVEVDTDMIFSLNEKYSDVDNQKPYTNQVLTVIETGVLPASAGSISYDSDDDALNFALAAGYFGDVELTYRVQDNGKNALSSEGKISFTVLEATDNLPPQLKSDPYDITVVEGGSESVELSDLVEDQDVLEQPLFLAEKLMVLMV